jgi:hypothetical protein
MAGKSLKKIAEKDPSIIIEEVDIMHQPFRTWKEGIRCIPALQIEGKTLSGIYLNQKEIGNFIDTFKKIK